MKIQEYYVNILTVIEGKLNALIKHILYFEFTKFRKANFIGRLEAYSK